MYPFFVDGKKVFDFSYKPRKNGVVRDDETGQWYEVTGTPEGRGRKIYGRKTINLDGADWQPHE